jgi:uncharacterized protein
VLQKANKPILRRRRGRLFLPMLRNAFHQLFKSPGPAVLPVIHVLDEAQASVNVEIAIREGAAGVFLINHDFPYAQFLPIIRHVRKRWPGLWLGVNFLAVTGFEAFPVLARLQAEGCTVDGYWADDARINEFEPIDTQTEAGAIAALKAKGGWNGFYTGGTCFKKQREVKPEHYAISAQIATQYMDAVCTSGVATGHAADANKIQTFRKAMGDHAMTLASGITIENAASYAADVDGFLVATGINHPGDFYNIDPARLRALLAVARDFGASS